MISRREITVVFVAGASPNAVRKSFFLLLAPRAQAV
jgi:lipopolysaccharide export LptBFGC system permease protein LptF